MTKTSRLLRHAATNRPLAQNPAHKLAQSHALEIYPADAIYTFIPKNACSTMRVSVALANGAIASLEEGHFIHRNNPTWRAELRALATARYTFAILRCPFARLLSCYLDKIVNRHPPMWQLLDEIDRAVEPEALTFRRFVDVLAESRQVRFDIHWRPQVDFLVYETYDDLFDMADMAGAAATLRDRIGFEVVDARGLTGHGTDGLAVAPGLGPDTPPLDLLIARRDGHMPYPRAMYDEPLVAAVHKHYAADIALMTRTFGAASVMVPG